MSVHCIYPVVSRRVREQMKMNAVISSARLSLARFQFAAFPFGAFPIFVPTYDDPAVADSGGALWESLKM